MRLTQALGFYIRYRRVPGLLRYGRNRVITPISVKAKRKAAELMVFEKQNIDILNRPYLSMAEETAFKSAVQQEPYIPKAQEDKMKFWKSLEELPPNVTTEDLLNDLKYYKKWE